MNHTNEAYDLLKPIPKKEFTLRQKELLGSDEELEFFDLYELRREPTRLDEFDWDTYRYTAIWRENETVILCTDNMEDFDLYMHCWTRFLFFTIQDDCEKMCFVIDGKTDAAVAETITFFWSLKQESNVNASLRVHNHEYGSECIASCFDFATLQPEQLSHILDSNPAREIILYCGKWTVEQAVILASRPYPLQMTLGADPSLSRDLYYLHGFSFMDGGTEFLSVLEKRESFFGSISLFYGNGQSSLDHEYGTGDDHVVPLDYINRERLLKLDLVDVGGLHNSNLTEESLSVFFSADVNALHCTLKAADFGPEDFEALNIASSDLSLTILLRPRNKWDTLLISFLNRLAQLGHFERLTLSLQYEYWSNPPRREPSDDESSVVEALIGAIQANPKLSHLDLGDTCENIRWNVHCNTIFGALEKHGGMRTFVVPKYKFDYETRMYRVEFDFSSLEQLLSRNRYIEVYEPSGKRSGKLFSNGPTIDNLYALNRFYRGSTRLVEESASFRPLLVSLTLANNASNMFQRIALLLAHHTDVLCEWIQEMDLDTADAAGSGTMENGPTLASVPAPLNQIHPKRKSRARASGAAKKPARDPK
jgi:hypothetical protein